MPMGAVVPMPTVPVVTLIDDVVIVEAVWSELTASVEKALVPDPVPGSNPLIEETVSVDREIKEARIVLPVRVDKLRVLVCSVANFDECNVK
jgi:hypothetical protein